VIASATQDVDTNSIVAVLSIDDSKCADGSSQQSSAQTSSNADDNTILGLNMLTFILICVGACVCCVVIIVMIVLLVSRSKNDDNDNITTNSNELSVFDPTAGGSLASVGTFSSAPSNAAYGNLELRSGGPVAVGTCKLSCVI
jgi:hypothetical protein